MDFLYRYREFDRLQFIMNSQLYLYMAQHYNIHFSDNFYFYITGEYIFTRV